MYEYTFEHKNCKATITVTADTASQAMNKEGLDRKVWVLIDKQNNY